MQSGKIEAPSLNMQCRFLLISVRISSSIISSRLALGSSSCERNFVESSSDNCVNTFSITYVYKHKMSYFCCHSPDIQHTFLLSARDLRSLSSGRRRNKGWSKRHCECNSLNQFWLEIQEPWDCWGRCWERIVRDQFVSDKQQRFTLWNIAEVELSVWHSWRLCLFEKDCKYLIFLMKSVLWKRWETHNFHWTKEKDNQSSLSFLKIVVNHTNSSLIQSIFREFHEKR